MKTTVGLLAIFIAITLALSVVSVANPFFITSSGLYAYADHEGSSDSGGNDDHGSDPEESEEQDNNDVDEEGDESGDLDEEPCVVEPSAEQAAEEQVEDEQAAEEQVEDEQAAEEQVEDGQENSDKEGEQCESEEEEQESKIRLELEDPGIEIEVELTITTMADGLYDVIFSCTEPVISETFADAFEVEDDVGEFEAEIPLANGTYNGCQLAIQDNVIPFDSFTVVDEEVNEKRKEQRHAIVTANSGKKIHESHSDAEPASPGEYASDLIYTLTATGLAEGDDDMMATATVEIDIAVWKSNGALVLLDVIDGTVVIGNSTYTVAIGYALYGIHSDTLRLAALVVEDATGDVYKLKLRGSAIGEDVEFPMNAGESISLGFEGDNGPSKNELDEWELTLDGTTAVA